MTREEEIQKASREYSDDSLARTCAYTDRTYECRRTLRLFNTSQIEQAFEDGVEWADKHTAKKQTATIEAWICKDKNNSLKICNEKPYRNMVLECWSSGVSSITIPKEMFPNITWDTTPKKVKVIIELTQAVLINHPME